MAKYYNKNNKWKHFFKTTSITILILLVIILLYNMYIKVDVNENKDVSVQKLSRDGRGG